jgi:hypothetical protein
VRRAAAAAIGVGLSVAAPLAGVRGPSYPDAPPPGMTGGFGEPTCATCHFPPVRPDVAGTLIVRGIPASHRAGAVYEVSIELERPGLERAGFELAARFADGCGSGRQAGQLAGSDAGVAVTEAAGVQYAHHTASGSRPPVPGRARWTVRWTAPARGSGAVAFHVVGNAANGDESPLGDHVYAFETTTAPDSPGGC